MIKFGVVIPCGQERLDNLQECLKYLSEQTIQPYDVVVVCDGFKIENPEFIKEKFGLDVTFVATKKHEPGLEQPRNIGVRHLASNLDYVWFLDCDCIADPRALEAYTKAHYLTPNVEKIMIGPYDWNGPGIRELNPDLRNDPRWDMLRAYEPDVIHRESLGVALGCFSGNLVWPIRAFKEIGGFWNELHMGRCEDGELGLRAASLGVPMIIVNNARAYHLHHEINLQLIHKKNERDVPMINKLHPWVQEKGIVMTAKDGIRFERICKCGEIVNTLEWWNHATSCEQAKGYS